MVSSTTTITSSSASSTNNTNRPPSLPHKECQLDELGYCFVKRCIEIIEARGLDDQGLYRISGVNSRVNKLLELCLNRNNFNALTGQVSLPDISDQGEWETKTITSALKQYLRNLTEPLMTYNLHPHIIDAAKIEDRQARTYRIKSLIQQLPCENFLILKLLVEHLRNVANHSSQNLMTISNLGICFAPTLMRGPDENAPSIREIKYSNVVTTTLIEEYDSFFNEPSLTSQLLQQATQNSYQYQQQHQQKQQQHLLQATYANNMGLTNPRYLASQFVPFHATEKPTYFPPPPIINGANAPFANSMQIVPPPPPVPPAPSYYDQQRPFATPQTTSYYPPNNYSSFHFQQPPLPPPPPLPSAGQQQLTNQSSDKVISLYPCIADSESELSFGPNEIIVDVRPTPELGWLVGTLERNGMRGLLPENYVKYI